MKDKKLKCYVLMIAKEFPATHKRAGDFTDFEYKIAFESKIHTIRNNYALWEKRIKDVNSGDAYLSVREWSDKPYNSKQVELYRFKVLGIERVIHAFGSFWMENGKKISSIELASNDGLMLSDFNDWFRSPPTEPMAIIHFTKFRYNENNR